MSSFSLADVASGGKDYTGVPGDDMEVDFMRKSSPPPPQRSLLSRTCSSPVLVCLVRAFAVVVVLSLLACSLWLLGHNVGSDEANTTAPTARSGPCASQSFNGTESAMHAAIRAQVASGFAGAAPGGIVIFGASTTSRYDTDVELSFRQESNFLYLTGYTAADARLLFDLVSGATTLFIPQRPVDYAVWNGAIEDPAAIAAKYGFTSVAYDRDFADLLQATASRTPGYVVYVMPGEASRLPSSPDYTTNSVKLREYVSNVAAGLSTCASDQVIHMYQPWQCVSVLYESRTNKTPLEIEVLRVASNVSSEAHIAVMQRSRAGLYEYNLQSMCVCVRTRSKRASDSRFGRFVRRVCRHLRGLMP